MGSIPVLLLFIMIPNFFSGSHIDDIRGSLIDSITGSHIDEEHDLEEVLTSEQKEKHGKMLSIYEKGKDVDDKTGKPKRRPPPTWTRDFLESNEYSQYAKESSLYHSEYQPLDLDVAIKLLEKRCPYATAGCSIKPKGHKNCMGYDIEYLKDAPHECERFTELKNRATRPVNIAVYTHTPAIYDKKATTELAYSVTSWEGAKQDKTNPIFDIHVINLIGVNFAAPPKDKGTFHPYRPVDFQYFLKDGKTFHPKKEVELRERIERMWNFAFYCATEKRLKNILAIGVGEKFFGGEMKETIARMNESALERISTRYPQINYCMPEDGAFLVPFNRHGFKFPECKYGNTHTWKFENTLFTNAWDPNTMVGNTNTESIDGGFGQMTAMAWLAWPGTNPAILQKVNIRAVPYPPKHERDYVY